MTDEEIAELVDANIEGIWRGEPGIPKSKAFSVIKNALKQQQEIIFQQASEIAQRDAKIFAYEAILQNSNFKMAVIKAKKDKE